MATLERAIQVAAGAHAGQIDKQGQPYILHPLRVMAGVEPPEARIVAVLHDVVEDTAVTLADLESEGFSPAVLSALRLVTHDPAEPYADYVVRCQSDPIARAVKLADLADNTRLDRVLMRPDSIARDPARNARYLLSYAFLMGKLTEEQYRNAMPAG